MGIRIVGCFDDDGRKHGMSIGGVPVLGDTADAAAYVKSEHVDRVYIALPMRAEAKIRKVFDLLQDTTASMYMVPDVLMFQLMDARMYEINGLPVFSLCETPLLGPFGLIKRLEDIVLASLILAVISPLMAAIAIAIKATSPGPILFKQRRYGLNGDVVLVWKFRTMTVLEDDHSVTQTIRHDPRVTPLGCILRRTSLDELPQFFNVLQGRMSIVGPRPHAIVHNEQYRRLIKGYMWRHKVKPGITGWAQVNGWRGETDSLSKMEKRVEYDIDYIRNWSVWLDAKIILMTIWKGFRNPNAY
jgi:putative colanic acid biosynthesis UDP-glucose lipid carrier transferase